MLMIAENVSSDGFIFSEFKLLNDQNDTGSFRAGMRDQSLPSFLFNKTTIDKHIRSFATFTTSIGHLACYSREDGQVGRCAGGDGPGRWAITAVLLNTAPLLGLPTCVRS
ncbi:hypothetical protein EVAR_14365_1 [Eumeta japonica]|uniref:Uncharacterized protein n=1 Tax=Eumeta variegata TaxID=151549 RepID=A0A4C1TX24_EUMVA|nr:hypothetical protein EVAR_14365_1 [Eumeta japonica]